MNKGNIIIAILVIAILTLLGYLLLHKSHSDVSIQLLKARVDSMAIHDRQRDTLYNQLQIIHTQDNIRIDEIEEQIDGTTAMINTINNVYNKKRVQLGSSTLDDKLRFLSGHLPQSSNH